MEVLALIIRSQKTWGTEPFTSSGCNLLNSDNRKPCCVDHDKAYRTGGWVISRLKADWELLKCLWKQNFLIAILMFVGVRCFGMWAFQYGKKRELWYEEEK